MLIYQVPFRYMLLFTGNYTEGDIFHAGTAKRETVTHIPIPAKMYYLSYCWYSERLI